MAEGDLPCQTSSLPLQQQFEVPGHLCKQLQSHPTDTPKRTVQTAMGPPRQPLTPPNPPSSPAPCRPKPWIPAASTRKYGNILPTRSGDSQTSVYVGGCQNYGLFFGSLQYGTYHVWYPKRDLNFDTCAPFSLLHMLHTSWGPRLGVVTCKAWLCAKGGSEAAGVSFRVGH